MELFRMKYADEQHARALGLPLTVVRATAFAELWIELLRKTAGRSGRPLVFGRGRNPINFVSVRDVATLVARVVTDERLQGQTYEIGGPDDLTMVELARRVSGCRDPRHVPPAVLAIAAAMVGGLRPALGRQMRAALVMDNASLTFAPAPVRNAVTGLSCLTVDDLLAESLVGTPTRE